MSDIRPGELRRLPSSGYPSNNSSEDGGFGEFIGGMVILLVGAGVFFFYAKEEFGTLWGILYSLFWYMTIPVHLIIHLFF